MTASILLSLLFSGFVLALLAYAIYRARRWIKGFSIEHEIGGHEDTATGRRG